MKVVTDTFASEKKIDDDLQNRRNYINELNDTIDKAMEGLAVIDQKKAELQETYGVAPDSQEQKDLELLEKRKESVRPNSNVTLTEEEKSRLEELDATERTEYQKRALEQDSYGGVYRKEIDAAKQTILEENAVIRGVKLERLKSSPMVDAIQESEDILEAAGKEILGMLVDEGKKHQDELQEKAEEKTDKLQEEKAEKEEQQEKLQEHLDEMDKLSGKDENQDNADTAVSAELPTENLLQLDALQQDVKAEVEKIVDNMKLVIEDIKGSVVDEKL
ncbi:MAG: hypothetical protein PHP50_00360 [Lachnospiraceae bacterium]|nr:hypothetical protein [Lachnospiraceae bacterium]